MSISNQTDKIFGTGDGSTTVFSFPFKIFATTDLVVYEVDTTQTPNVSHLKVLTTDYSVAINTVSEGGTVTFVTAPPATWQTLIQRVVQFTQSLSLNTEGNLPAQQIENQLDLMTMMCIQAEEATTRCLQLPVTFSGTLPLIIPQGLPSAAIGWDSTGQVLVNLQVTAVGPIQVPIINSNLAALTAANLVKGSSLFNLSTIPSGAGVIPTANLPSSLVNLKVVSFSYDISTASGSQVITGVGFKPKAAVFIAGVNSSTHIVSWGVDDGTNFGGIIDRAAASSGYQVNAVDGSMGFTDGAGNLAKGHISNFGSDGFTISWSKGGTPTGTATILALCIG